jgi:signal peptidase
VLLVLDALVLVLSVRLFLGSGLRAMLGALGSATIGLACAAFIAGGILPKLGVYRPVTVYSNSMRPVFGAGDMILVTPERAADVRVGQVITYAIPIGDLHTESHRIVRILKTGDRPVVLTKGDANSAVDPWNATLRGPTVWRYRARLPYLGYAVIALRMPFVRVLCLVVLPLLLASILIGRIWGYRIVRGDSRHHAAAL